MTDRTIPARAHGFTLIELLVSLAILSMCATMLMGGVTTVGIVARQAKASERASAEVGAAQMILRGRLESMLPLHRADLSDPLIDMEGSEQVFDFYGRPADNAPGSGLVRYRLLLTAPGDLMLFQVPELVTDVDRDTTSVLGWQGTTLLRRAASLSLAYYGATRDDRVPRWRSFWRDNSVAPQAVRVRIGFAPGDRRVWPDLFVRPAPTLDLTCDPEDSATRCGSDR